MANNRIYYAVHAVGIKEHDSGSAAPFVHGVQSVGITTNFNLQQVFELGQLAIYENIEDLPDVEVSLTKVLDGYPLIFHLTTTEATAPTLNGRSNARSTVVLEIYDDTYQSADGTPASVVECSGMYISSVTYNFPLDDSFTEDVTIVGNNKVWANDPNATVALPDAVGINIPASITGNADEPTGSGGVNRREDLLFGGTGATGNGIELYDLCLLPQDIPGIHASGWNIDNGSSYGAHLAGITVSADFGRTDINELGRKGPYHKTVDFPLEVTTEIEVTSHSGDLVSAREEGILTNGDNLSNRSIRICTKEGTRIFLGNKNKLSSVNYAGGDAGGGNVSTTYTYTTFNDLTVLHSGDVHASGSAWWAARSGYLMSNLNL